jgi:nicotinamidase-related amidase
MAANLGFNVTLVADATATHPKRGPDGAQYTADLVHRIEVASLNGEFAAVKNSAEVLAEVGDALPVRSG